MFTEIMDLANNPRKHLSIDKADEMVSEILQSPWILDEFGRAARVLGKPNVMTDTVQRLLATTKGSPTRNEMI